MSSREILLFITFMLGSLFAIRKCLILLPRVLSQVDKFNSNGILLKELNTTLKIGKSTKVKSLV